MNFSKHLILVAAAILIVFSRQSDAGILSTITSAAIDAVGSGISQFIESLQNAAAEGKQHNAYEDTKAKVQQITLSRGNNNLVDRIIKERNMQAIDYVKASADAMYDGLMEANSSRTNAIEILTRSIGKANEFIVVAGAELYVLYGIVTELSREAARNKLVITLKTVTDAGNVAFTGYEASRSLAAQGVEAGQDVLTQSVLAGFRGTQSTEEAAYKMIVKALNQAYDALDNNTLDVNSQINSEKDRAAAGSPKCQRAINEIQKSAGIASTSATTENKMLAIKVVTKGLINTLKTIARAGVISYNAMADAKKIENKELAIATITKAIDATKTECVFAVAIAQQALGAVVQIIGEQVEDEIIQAMIIIEKSRIALLEGLDRSYLIASQGIQNGNAKKGLSAGLDGVATAGFTAYAVIVNSGQYTLETIISKA